MRPSSSFLQTSRQYAALVGQLTVREVLGRYRGSVLGLAWSVVTPLLMLTVYTFVFSVVFQARWSGAPNNHFQFALMAFSGMAVFMLFSEVMARAPMLLVQNANYVKKVVFPLEVLPLVSIGVAVFHALIGFLVLTLFVAVTQGLAVTALALPLVLLPLLLLLLGLAWMLAALGVYLRDIGQAIGLLVTVLQFLSPVFYPASAVPDAFRAVMVWSPLTMPIEMIRRILLDGLWPDWLALGGYFAVSALVAVLGFCLFARLRKGFADVL
ncbi:ABC transporter permease [Chitinimonas arctica]|nr:ABC transporter permease [Chitinimonas arctica]